MSTTWERLLQDRFSPREAQRLLRITPIWTDEDLLPPRYIALAVEAWQDGELSEGQLARFLRTDRLGAREAVQELKKAASDGRDTDESIDLSAPLFSAAGR